MYQENKLLLKIKLREKEVRKESKVFQKKMSQGKHLKIRVTMIKLEKMTP